MSVGMQSMMHHAASHERMVHPDRHPRTSDTSLGSAARSVASYASHASPSSPRARRGSGSGAGAGGVTAARVAGRGVDGLHPLHTVASSKPVMPHPPTILPSTHSLVSVTTDSGRGGTGMPPTISNGEERDTKGTPGNPADGGDGEGGGEGGGPRRGRRQSEGPGVQVHMQSLPASSLKLHTSTRMMDGPSTARRAEAFETQLQGVREMLSRGDVGVPTSGMTPEEEDAHNSYMDKVARTQIRDMLYYAMFVAVFTFALLFNRNDQRIFHFTHSVEEHLLYTEMEFTAAHVEKTYFDLASAEEWFQYIRGPFRSVVYDGASFDGDEMFPISPANESTAFGAILNQRGSIVGHGRVIGSIRVGQVRTMTQQVACPRPPQFTAPDPEWACFEEVDPEPTPAAGQREFGYPNRISGLTWWSDTGNDEEPHLLSPTTSETYANPTVYTLLPNPHEHGASDKAEAILKDLQENHFVDLRTQAILLDMTIHNPLLDFTCVIRMAGEMPDSGGLVPLTRFMTLRLYRDYQFGDYVRVVAEVLVLLMVVRYTVLEFGNMRKMGVRHHLGKPGNMAHILNLVLFYFSTGFRIWSVITLPSSVDPDGPSFVDFRTSAHLLKTSTDINAFNAFLTWVKVFKYMEFIPKLKILLGTLGNAAGKISGFAFITAVVLFGSSQAFTLAFGTSLEPYRNLTQSFFSLTRVLFGDFDFEELRMESPFMGPLMFFCFTMLAVFVLLNMFIAIISDAFAETKAELEQLADVGVDTIGKAVARVVLNDGLYKVPLLGGRIQAMVEGAERQLAKMANNLGVMDLLALADKNKDGTLTAEEVANRLDADGDGVIAVEEFIESLVDVGTSRADAERIAAVIDENGDGLLSTEELSHLLAAQERVTRDTHVHMHVSDAGQGGAGAGGGAALGAGKAYLAPMDPPTTVQVKPRRPSVTQVGPSPLVAVAEPGSPQTPQHQGRVAFMSSTMDSPMSASSARQVPGELIDNVTRALAHTKIRIALHRRGHGAVLSRLGASADVAAAADAAAAAAGVSSGPGALRSVSRNTVGSAIGTGDSLHMREMRFMVARQARAIDSLSFKLDTVMEHLQATQGSLSTGRGTPAPPGTATRATPLQ